MPYKTLGFGREGGEVFEVSSNLSEQMSLDNHLIPGSVCSRVLYGDPRWLGALSHTKLIRSTKKLNRENYKYRDPVQNALFGT